MEWVYNEPTDEPTVYEGESLAKHEKSSHQYVDLFSSKAPVEEPISEPDIEEEYYGDEDVVEERMSPVKAFEVFAGRTFPIGRRPDFSGSIYAEASDSVVRQKPRSVRDARLPSSESRSEKIARLATEIDALASESGTDENDKHADAFTQLQSLRDQLNQIDNSIRTQTGTRQRNLSVLPRTDREVQPDINGLADTGVTLQMVSPRLSAVSTLERRVAALEKSMGMGVCQFDSECDGDAIGPVLEDVRTRLALMTDKSLPAKLKRDARDIAEVLQKDLLDDRGAQMLHAATVLEKMEKWEHLTESIPILVERLRSLKRVQDEAEQFSATLAALGAQMDTLQQRSDANVGLIGNVRKSLEVNVKTITENLDLLNERITSMDRRDD